MCGLLYNKQRLPAAGRWSFGLLLQGEDALHSGKWIIQRKAKPMAEALFELHNAQVVRAGKAILSIDEFRLDQGEHIALLGPNGAGKSTFVQLITREVMPLYRDEPPVLFKGNPRALLTDVRKSLGIVSATMQEQIKVHLSAVEIVEGGLFGTLGLPRYVQPTEASHKAALDALEMLGIASLAERDVLTLSSGQGRRVLLARALVSQPETLILDEPCTGLDPEGMYYVRKSMRTLAQAGVGIILITHYPEDVIPEVQRLVLIKDGTLFADGSKEELLTSDTMSQLFDVPLKVARSGGTDEYFSLVSEY